MIQGGSNVTLNKSLILALNECLEAVLYSASLVIAFVITGKRVSNMREVDDCLGNSKY